MLKRLPVNRQVVTHLRFEVNAAMARWSNRWRPRDQRILRQLKTNGKWRVNVGCGPFGQVGWVNLDLFDHPGVTLTTDCRRSLPMADGSCKGIHVEHFLEHLHPVDERASFLNDCFRCLAPGGILRVIVPDAAVYLRAYLEPGWNALNNLGCGGERPESLFTTKMEALSHVFVQNGEHYGGFDVETLEQCLRAADFKDIQMKSWRIGSFPEGCIDREQHRPYSLYMEARR